MKLINEGRKKGKKKGGRELKKIKVNKEKKGRREKKKKGGRK